MCCTSLFVLVDCFLNMLGFCFYFLVYYWWVGGIMVVEGYVYCLICMFLWLWLNLSFLMMCFGLCVCCSLGFVFCVCYWDIVVGDVECVMCGLSRCVPCFVVLFLVLSGFVYCGLFLWVFLLLYAVDVYCCLFVGSVDFCWFFSFSVVFYFCGGGGL